MFKAAKIINSKNKTNIRFVAAGSYQIEFFENEGKDFFTIYRFNYGGEGGSQYYLINLSEVSTAKLSENEFQIVVGLSTYKVRITKKGKALKVYVSRFIWGWLPFSRLGGKLSEVGLSTLKKNLELYASDMAA